MKKFLVSGIMTMVMSLGLYAVPVFANGTSDGDCCTGDHTRERCCVSTLRTTDVLNVAVDNLAVITNVIEASSGTGDNKTEAGEGGDGGSGGEAEAEGSDPLGGYGGNGGDGGNGGFITTGDATTMVAVENKANENKITVNSADLTNVSTNPSETTIRRITNVPVINTADLMNAVEAHSDTGYNETEGEDAGKGGSGGEAEAEENSDALVIGGDGGSGGDGGNGGEICTGDAKTDVAVLNVTNRNMIRIHR